jgi:hypothetical protein
MSASRFLFPIEGDLPVPSGPAKPGHSPHRASRRALLVGVLGVLAGTACCGGNDACGPGTAAADGLELAGTGVDVHYTDLRAMANNDCPAVGEPADVTSLTLTGTQTGSSFSLLLCIPRPDLLGAQPVQLGTDVQIKGLGASIGGGCTLDHAVTAGASGTVTASGVCGKGKDPAGFALTFDGVVPMKRTCGAMVDTLDLALTGTVAVAGPTQ